MRFVNLQCLICGQPLGFSHAILDRIRGKMEDKIFHLNKTPLTGCSTENWFILILRELAINSKKDMGF
jgi:hypothetical protein